MKKQPDNVHSRAGSRGQCFSVCRYRCWRGCQIDSADLFALTLQHSSRRATRRRQPRNCERQTTHLQRSTVHPFLWRYVLYLARIFLCSLGSTLSKDASFLPNSCIIGDQLLVLAWHTISEKNNIDTTTTVFQVEAIITPRTTLNTSTLSCSWGSCPTNFH